ncbi:hypothetical protein F3Y22_tig00110704pilonHSYRG00011 [Hibiscus syriacus]|uniref:Reverse transcriptase zinc-binding domain-containing protein n=1 Tax=Hibiscus syriacus TaxID=106335 RepID=A0A6A2ZUK3_HIBSY|nr:hypothetical protein F3Y22_tig00110704pilonHSYRG00011 [Hibiscus syriacus]
MWRNITHPISKPDAVFVNRIKLVLGDGKSIDFWHDFWTEVASLKESFPIMYLLALNKSGYVKDFSEKIKDTWHWSIELRRTLFVWEEEIWDSFIVLLNRATASLPSTDYVIWTGSPDGQYYPKRFCEIISSADSAENQVWNLVWAKLAPLKVESFVWKAVHGRVPTLVELLKRGVAPSNSPNYVLCCKEAESIDHLFFHCELAWSVWMKWLSLWCISFTFPGDFRSAFHAWVSCPVKLNLQPIWKLVFFIWTIRLYRNEVVFKNDKFSPDRIFDLALLGIGFWVKVNGLKRWHLVWISFIIPIWFDL